MDKKVIDVCSASRGYGGLGGEDLSLWSEKILIPFEVKKLRWPNVLWINARWFLEEGIDVSDHAVEASIKTWLLTEFSYARPMREDPDDGYLCESKVVYADRYGSTHGFSPHGGSGRVATVGRIQVKGVGTTPLVGIGSDWLHSNGCAWVEESIREAIYSEIACAEFPHTAVPVIAIIDTGLVAEAPPTSRDPSGRRALLIRPSVLRLAHLQRAPFFTQAKDGYRNSQSDDARRTRDIVRTVAEGLQDDECKEKGSAIKALFKRIAQQVAFGQVHRLFNGGYFASNVSITGALLDFGAMRAMPDWSKATVLNRTAGFGEEMEVLRQVIESIVFYYNKFKPEQIPDELAESIILETETAIAQAFDRECLRLWAISDQCPAEVTRPIVHLMRLYFQRQQQRRSNYQTMKLARPPWLSSGFHKMRSAESCLDQERATIEKILSTINLNRSARGILKGQLELSQMTARRLLEPRNLLEREELQRDLHNRVLRSSHAEAPCPETISAEIQNYISSGRRCWPRAPQNLIIYGQVTTGYSSALCCREAGKSGVMLWLEGIRFENRALLFGTWIALRASAQELSINESRYWSAIIRVGQFERQAPINVELEGQTVQAPPMSIWYQYPWSTAEDEAI